MTAVFAKRALLPEGWRDAVRLEIDGLKIASVVADATAKPGDTRVDSLLPALANLHSHTFQRAMAGMTERRGAGPDSFWTWRDLMYRFLDVLTPEDIEAIAALAFMEMQEQGFAAVAEFHYVHHQKNGARFSDVAELSQRIIAAAKSTGIGLTHLPVLYARGGLDNAALAGGQLRFGNSVEQLLVLRDGAASTIKRELSADSRIGVAPHSLRAVSKAQLAETAKACADGPIHIHVAEQTREVEDVLQATGKRPLRLLLDTCEVSANWCLIHATHLDEGETRDMAQSRAVAGLCPITEANLGDGTFAAVNFLAAAGTFGIGTDSNICITAAGELAQLEYSQRLLHKERNILAESNGSTGQFLWRGAAKGGAQALQRNSGAISPGKLADLVAIDSDTEMLAGLTAEQLLDGLVFASRAPHVTDLWSAGRHCVKGGRHIARDAIAKRYRITHAALTARM